MSEPGTPSASSPIASIRTIFRVEEGGNSVEVTLAGWHSTENAIAILEEALRQVKAGFAPQKAPVDPTATVHSIGSSGFTPRRS